MTELEGAFLNVGNPSRFPFFVGPLRRPSNSKRSSLHITTNISALLLFSTFERIHHMAPQSGAERQRFYIQRKKDEESRKKKREKKRLQKQKERSSKKKASMSTLPSTSHDAIVPTVSSHPNEDIQDIRPIGDFVGSRGMEHFLHNFLKQSIHGTI